MEPGCSGTGFWDVGVIGSSGSLGPLELGVKKRLEMTPWTWGSESPPPPSPNSVLGWLEHLPGHPASQICHSVAM